MIDGLTLYIVPLSCLCFVLMPIVCPPYHSLQKLSQRTVIITPSDDGRFGAITQDLCEAALKILKFWTFGAASSASTTSGNCSWLSYDLHFNITFFLLVPLHLLIVSYRQHIYPCQAWAPSRFNQHVQCLHLERFRMFWRGWPGNSWPCCFVTQPRPMQFPKWAMAPLLSFVVHPPLLGYSFRRTYICYVWLQYLDNDLTIFSV